MVLSLASDARIYLATEPTDMRKSFDGLSAIVQHRFHRDPFDGDVFVFLNRRRDRIKILVWDRNGFWIAMKRLERGTFEAWRATTDDGGSHVEIPRAQLAMLLEGIEMKRVKFRRQFVQCVRIGGRDGRSRDEGGHRSQDDRCRRTG